jgi:hypothetical protein
VTVKCQGSRHSCLSTSPGCGGLCIFMVTSMVVLVVYAIDLLPGTSEGYAPVAAHLRGPRALSGAAQFVNLPRLGLLPSQADFSFPTVERQLSPSRRQSGQSLRRQPLRKTFPSPFDGELRGSNPEIGQRSTDETNLVQADPFCVSQNLPFMKRRGPKENHRCGDPSGGRFRRVFYVRERDVILRWVYKSVMVQSYASQVVSTRNIGRSGLSRAR